MGTIDELDQTEAVFTAIAKRLKQLGQDAAEVERIRILLYIRGGELLDDPKLGGNRNPYGVNQYSKPEVTSRAREVTSPKSQVEMNRDWQWRARKSVHKWHVST
jgi:hypothetical protein